MEVLLDSNFIISCIKRKIDFLSQLKILGFRVILPREVLQELKDLRLSSRHEERVAIDLAFQLIEKKEVKKMKLGNKTVDLGLIDKGKEGAYIATLDNNIKRIVQNKVIINNASNRIEIERS